MILHTFGVPVRDSNRRRSARFTSGTERFEAKKPETRMFQLCCRSTHDSDIRQASFFLNVILGLAALKFYARGPEAPWYCPCSPRGSRKVKKAEHGALPAWTRATSSVLRITSGSVYLWFGLRFSSAYPSI